jgi:hypothetical protein
MGKKHQRSKIANACDIVSIMQENNRPEHSSICIIMQYNHARGKMCQYTEMLKLTKNIEHNF